MHMGFVIQRDVDVDRYDPEATRCIREHRKYLREAHAAMQLEIGNIRRRMLLRNLALVVEDQHPTTNRRTGT